MPEEKQSQTKTDTLKEQGNLNPHPERVVDPLFKDDRFFDPYDLLQVKYEMLRRVQCEGQSVTQTADDFGFSRRAFYQIQTLFKQGGLMELLPQKRGPRKRHKLTPVVLDFLNKQILEKASVSSDDLVRAVEEHFGLRVHKRTIERALRAKKK